MTREEARTGPKLNQQGPAASAAGDLMEALEVLSGDPEVTMVEERKCDDSSSFIFLFIFQDWDATRSCP